MKKIFLIMLTLGIFAACDPMEDVYDELDKERIESGEAAPTAELEFELTDDDYAMSGDDNVADFKNFSDEEDAKTLIPVILNAKYPHLGKGSLAKVTYALYNPVRIGAEEEYTLVDQDYTDMGLSYTYFKYEDQPITFLKAEYPDAVMNNVKELTLEFRTGKTPDGDDITETQTRRYAYIDGEWMQIYVLTDDDYDNMESGLYDNFNDRDEAEYRLSIYLKDGLAPYAEENDVKLIQAAVYNSSAGRTDQHLIYLTLTGGSWTARQSVVSQTLSLGHDGTTWVPDNTIKYELTSADYAAIADANPGDAGSNLGTYGNFSTSYWSDEDIFTAIAARLMDIFPSAEEGQKYQVKYVVYNGATVSLEQKFIKEGSEYVVFEE